MRKNKHWNMVMGILCMSLVLVLSCQGVWATEPGRTPNEGVSTESVDRETASPAEDVHNKTVNEMTPKNTGTEENAKEEKTEDGVSDSIEKPDHNNQPEEPKGAKEPSEAELEKDCVGWVQRESGWYYYAAQGQRYTGWLFHGNQWYYLNEQDAEHPGRMAASKELAIGGSYYRFDGGGAMVRGWYQDGADWYYYNPSGVRVTGWIFDGNNWYYLDGQDAEHPGRMAASKELSIEGILYRFGGSGAMARGWYQDGADWYYYNPSGVRVTGWIFVGNNWYYLDEQDAEHPGRMAASKELSMEGILYRFDGSGAMVRGWYQDGAGWYYYNQSGGRVIGWIFDGNNWYYLDGQDAEYPGRMAASKELSIEGILYRFDGSGAMVRGWYQDGAGWYYYNSSGVPVNGWAFDGNNWYYMDGQDAEHPGRMIHDCWKDIDGARYYFHGSGAMAQGWLSLGGEWYYMAPGGGQMLTGWQCVGGTWYYLYQAQDAHGGTYGVMAKNCYIDSYWVDGSGKWLTPHLYSMQMRANGYSSPTPYLILVDCSANKVAVFQGSQGNWTNIQYWDCACGAAGTPTIKGIFRVGIRGHHFDSGGVRLYWYTQIYGDYLFHSLPYLRSNGRLWDGRLGIGTSHGCVRLPIECSKWIYDVIPTGTTVVTF